MSTKISAASAVSTLSDSYALPLSTGGSSANKVTVSTLAQYATKYCSGINVVHSGSGNDEHSVDLPRYVDAQSSYVPIGLEIVDCSHPLIIALTEPDAGTMYWNSASGTKDTTITSLKSAVLDFDGEAHCEAAALSDADYAMGYCSTFECCGGGTTGLGTGQWWLPSVGELRLINRYFTAINMALSILSTLGYTTTQLQRAGYWSSTEYSSSYAWHVGFYGGYVNTNSKASNSNRVRPVSAYQSWTTIS